MKKIVLLLFTTIFLSSCTLSMGGTERHWEVYKIKSNGDRNGNKAIYTVVSFDSDGYYRNGFKFEDQYGKFQIGDTVELVKLKH